MKPIKKISPAESRKSKHAYFMVSLTDGKYKGKTVRVGADLKNKLVKQKRGKLAKADPKSDVEL